MGTSPPSIAFSTSEVRGPSIIQPYPVPSYCCWLERDGPTLHISNPRRFRRPTTLRDTEQLFIVADYVDARPGKTVIGCIAIQIANGRRGLIGRPAWRSSASRRGGRVRKQGAMAGRSPPARNQKCECADPYACRLTSPRPVRLVPTYSWSAFDREHRLICLDFPKRRALSPY